MKILSGVEFILADQCEKYCKLDTTCAHVILLHVESNFTVIICGYDDRRSVMLVKSLHTHLKCYSWYPQIHMLIENMIYF